MIGFFDTHGRPVEWTREKLSMRVSGYAIIERDMPPESHELLMIRTKQSPFLELPGGGVEPGKETLQDAVMRECVEEIGCRVALNGQIFFQEDRGFYDLHGFMQRFYHACNHWYLATTEQRPVVPVDSSETTDIVWVEVSSILSRMEEIHPVHRAAVRALVAVRYEKSEQLNALGRQLLLPVGMSEK